jgi:hypothetical protein
MAAMSWAGAKGFSNVTLFGTPFEALSLPQTISGWLCVPKTSSELMT